MIITICGSVSFFEQMQAIKTKLESMGHFVYAPIKVPGINYSDEPRARRTRAKQNLHFVTEHRYKIERANAILVVNLDKPDGQKNYIGFNTADEILHAYCHRKKIYFLNPVPEEQVFIADEMHAVEPMILDGDLDRIFN